MKRRADDTANTRTVKPRPAGSRRTRREIYNMFIKFHDLMCKAEEQDDFFTTDPTGSYDDLHLQDEVDDEEEDSQNDLEEDNPLTGIEYQSSLEDYKALFALNQIEEDGLYEDLGLLDV